MPVRKALGVRTVFNILGPLLNPAGAARLLIGVYAPELVPLMAHALFELKVERAMVVHCGGLDELAPIAVADVAEVTLEGVSFSTLDPFELGLARCSIADLMGGEADENAIALRRVINGECPGPLEVSTHARARHESQSTAVRAGVDRHACRSPAIAPPQDTVVLNAGAALYVYGSAASVREGCEMARASIKAGQPLKTLDTWVTVCKRFA